MDLEKDIERCRRLTEVQNASWVGTSNQLAILHLLEDYERQKIKLDKVTDKLKEDIENADNNIKHMKEKTILQTIARELAVGMNDYAREILNLIEGGKR